jgi:hypothetical protein
VLIGDIPGHELARRLRREGVHLVTGAVTTHVRAALPRFVAEFADMYADYPVEDPPGIDDARVRIAAPSLLRRYFAPQAKAWLEGKHIFGPVPAHRAFTNFETTLNWSIALSDVAPMFMHAAVLERDGRALVMPAASGSGKSTLCGALACRGWRLFSDEMAIFCFETGRLRPNPRPVSLKNNSIGVIAGFEPRAHMSRIYHGTPKGDIAFMRPPREAVTRSQETAVAGLVVTPVYTEGAAASLASMERAEGFQLLTDNAINYSSMLQAGFEMLAGIADRCGFYRLTYSNLDEAIQLIDRLHAESAPDPLAT